MTRQHTLEQFEHSIDGMEMDDVNYSSHLSRSAFLRMDYAMKDLMHDLKTLEKFACALEQMFLRTGTFDSVRSPEAFTRIRTKVYKHRSKVGCFVKKLCASRLGAVIRPCIFNTPNGSCDRPRL